MATDKKEIRNVDDYIATLTPEQQKHIEKLRKLVIGADAKLEEGLNYSTPAYRSNGKLVIGIAAAKTHMGFYVMSEAVIERFKDELKAYEVAKTSFKIPLGNIPSAVLIKQIISARIAENNSKSAKSGTKGKQ